MIGYTRKVGLRKSRLHFDAIRARQVVRPSEELRWVEGILAQINRESSGTQLVDDIDRAVRTVNALEQKRRDEALRAAKAKVDALPVDQRVRLEGEFQRAEREAAAIMRHGRRWR